MDPRNPELLLPSIGFRYLQTACCSELRFRHSVGLSAKNISSSSFGLRWLSFLQLVQSQQMVAVHCHLVVVLVLHRKPNPHQYSWSFLNNNCYKLLPMGWNWWVKIIILTKLSKKTRETEDLVQREDFEEISAWV